MLQRIYLGMSRTERELLIKFLLCTIISTAVSWAIGTPYSPSTAVTAVLYLYIDRGYCGGFYYAMKRIEVQIVQGALLILPVFLFKFYLPHVPDPVVIAVSACVAITLGLPINFKHQIAPLNCTLANATFIIVTSMITSVQAYPYRVLHCVIGFLIGYIVNNFIVPQHDRYQDALERLSACTRLVIGKTKDPESSKQYDAWKQLAETDLKHLVWDDKKSGLKRYRRTPEQFALVEKLHEALLALELLEEEQELYRNQVDADFWNHFQNELRLWHNVHCQISEQKTADAVPQLSHLTPRTQEESILATDLFRYSQRVSALLDIQALPESSR